MNATEFTVCTGTYCVAMKYTITKENISLETVQKGCLSGPLNVPEMGCYSGLNMVKWQNLVVCFCNTDKCNTNVVFNSIPKIARNVTCAHYWDNPFDDHQNGTCTGYACTTEVEFPYGTKRGCEDEPLEAFYAIIRENTYRTSALQPYCIQDRIHLSLFHDISIKKCKCYENHCNSPENDTNWPEFPRAVRLNCLKEQCTGSESDISCGYVREGCEGQYCMTSK